MTTGSEPPKNQNQPKKSGNQGVEAYNTIAETVGMLPSLRLKDNVIQAIVIASVTCIAVVVGSVVGGWGGALVAALVGLVASTLISGFVLMVLGWIRAAQKLDR